MKKIWIIMVIALITLVSSASAQMVSFADPDSTVHKGIYLYNASGTLLGSYNTTSTGINITDAGDVFFVIKPQYSNPLDDPTTWVDNAFSFVETNLISLIAIMFLTGLLLTRR